MKSNNAKRLLYGLTMALAGLLGLMLVAFFFLAMSGISTPVSCFDVIFAFAAALSGPLMLLTGGSLLAVNVKPRAAAWVGLAGAAVVTLWSVWIVGSAIVDAIHPSPNPAIDSAIDPRDAMIYGILVVATLTTDWVGYRALRLSQ
jgi:hypothetical protein